MKISAIAPWFGGKRTLAPVIVEELGPHSSYWELLCGSMAVLLVKPRSSNETVNDLHGDLVNLARVIKHERLGPMLYRQMRRWLLSEELFVEAATRYRRRTNTPATGEPDLERAADFFVCSWFGRNGVAGTQSYNQGFCRRFTRNGGHAATRWESAVASIPAWRRRMRHITILNGDAITLCERIEDDPAAVIYADPPYLVKGSTYVHDFTPANHEALAAALRRFRRLRVVVSYYDDPRLAELYPGWTVRHCPVTKSLVNQGMRGQAGAVMAPEVLLINGPSCAVENGLFGGQK